MRMRVTRQSLWALVVGCTLTGMQPAHASRSTSMLDVSGDASRMAFKSSKKNKKEPTCQLTLMHVYTSKFNKKHTQFAFTGSVVAKREAGKPMVMSVIGQNHQLSATGKGIQPFAIPRMELGVEDTSVRRFTGRKSSCKKNSVCAEYKDSKKKELNIRGGVEVTGLGDGSLARAGIRPGDVIIRVADVDITGVKQFEALVKGLDASRAVPVFVRRADSTLVIPVRPK